jgi:hypothetical protein
VPLDPDAASVPLDPDAAVGRGLSLFAPGGRAVLEGILAAVGLLGDRGLFGLVGAAGSRVPGGQCWWQALVFLEREEDYADL